MRRYPLTALIVFVSVPLLLGCLLAPWVQQVLQGWEGHPWFGRLAGDRFERVATRCVQVIALLLIGPCLKYSGTLERVGPMLRWTRARGGSFLRWFALGFASMLTVYAAGFWAGMYEFSPHRASAARLAISLTDMLIGSLLIGLLEEYLFRGFVFGALRKRFSIAVAATASSAFFSLVHFLRPKLPAQPEALTWTSGFELIPHMFARFRPAYDWDFALTLFFMGMALCALMARHGQLYGIAGLHTGWVWVLQSGKEFVIQNPRRHNFWFGWGENPAQGALVTVVAAVFALTAWILLLRCGDCHSRPKSDTTSP